MIEKNKPIRDAAWLEKIRHMDCIVCQKTPCDPAHIRVGTNGGMGMKPGDDYVIPLCHECHSEQHRIGEKTFWTRVLSNNGSFTMFLMRTFARQLYLNRHGL